jgi:DNA-binding NarL/FixJ family response regulator
MVRPASPLSDIIPNFWTAEKCQEMATVRVLLVDDFAPFRSYVRRILEEYSEWEVIGEAADGLAGFQMALEQQPDLILLDIGLPELNGIDVAHQLVTMVPPPKIIFVTSHTAADVVQAALSAGAMGYVVKWDANRELLRAMKAVMAGKQFVSKRLSGHESQDPT